MKSKLPRRFARVGLVGGGLLLGLLLSEVVLMLFGLPHFHQPHHPVEQFYLMRNTETGAIHHVNMPSERIRFVYADNPRGYFGSDNHVDHFTNRLGFRGEEFDLQLVNGQWETNKPDDEFRMVFLGDSFTFGEGVWGDDIYSQVTTVLLEKRFPSSTFRAYNFGVGGYNTTQSLTTLQDTARHVRPDVVVLGYVLNDAEPPLFAANPLTGEPYRVPRPIEVEESLGDAMPPDTALYMLRTSRLIWQRFAARTTTRETIDHYRDLYQDTASGWQASRRSLQEIVDICRDDNTPCCVLLFPVLYQLDERYPFRNLHAKIRDEAESAGAIFLDLLPELEGIAAEELWVHPSDHHPNEKVHALAAEVLSEALVSHGILPAQ